MRGILVSLKKEKKISSFPDSFSLSFPVKDEFGDFTTNLPFLIKSKLSTEEIASLIAEEIRKIKIDYLQKVEVKKGFLNFFLSNAFLYENLINIGRASSATTKKKKRILLEFVSANPTGPLTIAHGRQASFGEALSRLLEETGYKVDKEYYLNDRGRQIEILGKSFLIRYLQTLGKKVSLPEDGYQGDYLKEMARELNKKYGPSLKDKPISFFEKMAVSEILKVIKKDLKEFGIRFTHFFRESKLFEGKKIEKVLRALRKGGYLYKKEGALFFKSTSFGDDKDRVLRKKDGTFTYFASDIAYHKDKLKRGYDLLIDLWGPDHIGYINRVKAAMAALGEDPKRLKIIIIQLTTLFRNKKKLPMSTRKGEFLSLAYLIKELGEDIPKFFFLSRKAESHLNFDLSVAKKESSENPVYYLQYAQARINSLSHFRKEKGFKDPFLGISGPTVRRKMEIYERLKEEEEINLGRKVARFPIILGESSSSLDPQILFSFLFNLAKSFHRYYQKFRIISDDEKLSLARLSLSKGVGTILNKGLSILGIRAPEKM